jgi:hypothetical protein
MNAVEHLCESPKRVGLDYFYHILGQRCHIARFQRGVCPQKKEKEEEKPCQNNVKKQPKNNQPKKPEQTGVVGQENGEKRRHEVVHALHIAAAGVPNGPHIQDAFHHRLHDGLLEQRQAWRRAGDINLDLHSKLI